MIIHGPGLEVRTKVWWIFKRAGTLKGKSITIMTIQHHANLTKFNQKTCCLDLYQQLQYCHYYCKQQEKIQVLNSNSMSMSSQSSIHRLLCLNRDMLSSVEHNIRCLAQCSSCSFPHMKMKSDQKQQWSTFTFTLQTSFIQFNRP